MSEEMFRHYTVKRVSICFRSDSTPARYWVAHAVDIAGMMEKIPTADGIPRTDMVTFYGVVAADEGGPVALRHNVTIPITAIEFIAESETDELGRLYALYEDQLGRQYVVQDDPE